MKRCFSCKKTFSDEAMYCTVCGNELSKCNDCPASERPKMSESTKDWLKFLCVYHYSTLYRL